MSKWTLLNLMVILVMRDQHVNTRVLLILTVHQGGWLYNHCYSSNLKAITEPLDSLVSLLFKTTHLLGYAICRFSSILSFVFLLIVKIVGSRKESNTESCHNQCILILLLFQYYCNVLWQNVSMNYVVLKVYFYSSITTCWIFHTG